MRKCTLEFVCYLPRKIPNFGTSLRNRMKVSYTLASKKT